MGRHDWMILGSLAAFLVFSPAVIAATQSHENEALAGQRHVKRTVEQIKGDQLQINTGEGTPRYIPLNTAREKHFPDIKIGDTIELTLNEQNLLVGYHLLNDSGQAVV